MCPQGQDGADFKKGFMDLQIFQKVIREAALFQADVNLFMGGESLLHPKICEMIAYCRDQHVPARLYTNATLLDERKSEEIILAGLDHITFSFDGIDKASYEEYRRGAVYEKALGCIQGFLKKKKDLRMAKPKVVIQCLELGSGSRLRRSKREFQDLFDTSMVDRFTYIQPHRFAGVYKDVPVRGNRKKYSPCAFLWYSMSIIWDGSVVPCCIDVFKKHPIGSARELPLETLWHSDSMIKLRRLIYEGHYSEVELCRECDILWKSRFFGIPARSAYNFFDVVSSMMKFTARTKDAKK
jgi:radical SAM protein with 4Fe4S-binding SPASM domain